MRYYNAFKHVTKDTCLTDEDLFELAEETYFTELRSIFGGQQIYIAEENLEDE